MPTTQYLAFGTGVSPAANTLSFTAYSATTALISAGYVAGTADAQHINTVLRQATVGVAGVAKFATDNGLLNCLDDGSPTNFALALKSAVDTLIKLANPPGTMSSFGMATAPTGWLECTGAAVSRSTYAALFAAIGTTWGAGNGTTTFNLPDARGYVLRGWDHGAGTDPGRAFGSTQADEFKSHTHPGVHHVGGTDTYSQQLTYSQISGPGQGDELVVDGGILARGGAETRMKNIAVLVCIKT